VLQIEYEPDEVFVFMSSGHLLLFGIKINKKAPKVM
jgi:hypothetical protein